MNTSVRYETVDIRVMPEITVPGVVGTPEWWPSGRRVGVILAHDQGGGLDQPLVVALQGALAAQGHLTVRFAFPFAHEGRTRPDTDAILQRTYRAATGVLLADRDLAPTRLLAVGVGLGARVAALAVSAGLNVDGIAALGFPLHLAGKPHLMRADALFRIVCPILFVQGDRDPHCRIDRLESLLQRLGAPSRVHVVRDAGQGLEPIKRTERTREEIFAEVIAAVETFLQKDLGVGDEGTVDYRSMSPDHSPIRLSAVFGAEGRLLSRLRRVFQLDDSVYAEIQGDLAAIPQAFAIVIGTSVLVGLGQASLHGLFLGIATASVLWLLATGLLWLAGSIVVGDRTDYVSLLRCTGFAYAWFSLLLLGSLPFVGWIFGWAAVALCFTSLVIATRRILETTTGQALGICAVALGLPVLLARCLGA